MSLAEFSRDEIPPHKLWRINKMMKEKVFFIKCGEFVRITRSSSSPKWVMAGMQPYCPYEMTVIKVIPGGLKMQQELEKTFAGYRHASLWFRYEGSLKQWIDSQ